MSDELDEQNADETIGGQPGTDSIISGIQSELDDRIAQLKDERAQLEDQCERLEREYREHQREIDQVGRELAHLTELYKAVERNHTTYLDDDMDGLTVDKSLAAMANGRKRIATPDDLASSESDSAADFSPQQRVRQRERERMQAHLLKRLKWWVFGKKKGRDRL
ncbi:hypothetical protein [Halegenticoccus tardaugens]|uniref:hypothetical protein n=1 Tax=Halegenticoccus tardaugens TaxID=2071624 RepID=UPI00100ADE70|nr:hypothetical protein [Halegenticoccus tardaugens]